MKAGRSGGDLTHPLPYAPEFYKADYKSLIADLRNTTSDRMNASSASAGWFSATTSSTMTVPGSTWTSQAGRSQGPGHRLWCRAADGYVRPAE